MLHLLNWEVFSNTAPSPAQAEKKQTPKFYAALLASKRCILMLVTTGKLFIKQIARKFISTFFVLENFFLFIKNLNFKERLIHA